MLSYVLERPFNLKILINSRHIGYNFVSHCA